MCGICRVLTVFKVSLSLKTNINERKALRKKKGWWILATDLQLGPYPQGGSREACPGDCDVTEALGGSRRAGAPQWPLEEERSGCCDHRDSLQLSAGNYGCIQGLWMILAQLQGRNCVKIMSDTMPSLYFWMLLSFRINSRGYFKVVWFTSSTHAGVLTGVSCVIVARATRKLSWLTLHRFPGPTVHVAEN